MISSAPVPGPWFEDDAFWEDMAPIMFDPGTNPDGTPYSGATNLATTQAPTTVIADAHKAGLFVHIFTFRNESKYLANDYEGDPEAEYLKFFRLGVDGVFTDFSSTAVTARTAFLNELGRTVP